MEQLDVFEIKKRLRKFAEDRDWEQFHTPKNLSMALSVEASELLEIFQWLSPEESKQIKNSTENISRVKDELADILLYAIRLSDRLDINLNEAIEQKMIKNAQKYPADKVKGSAKKYTEY
jgi:NTP pyrophosphatase (non-canonical NTP hydrolase)